MKFEPLKGIKILDLTSVVVGPVSTSRLGQYGADIIKIEHPNGDLMRGLGGLSPTGEHSGTYLHLNRGKRNICLDLKTEKGIEICRKLIKWSDVIVANMRPKALKRLGLDADKIRAEYPEKIHCLITGYGTNGPYAGQPTYDSVLQGASGIPGLFLARDGEPSYVPMLICDHVVGEITSGVIMAAIIQNKTSGKGASIEVPMFETMASFVLQEHLAQGSFDPPMGPPGDLRLLSPHNKPVRTKDGYISFTINTDSQVQTFLKVTNRVEVLKDKRFATIASRAEYVFEWFEIRGAPLKSKTTDEWVKVFRAADLPAMPCHTLETLPKDPHIKAVKLIDYEGHATEGKTAVIRSTMRINGETPSVRSSAAPRGWDTDNILNEMGYSETEIDSFKSQKTAFSYEAP